MMSLIRKAASLKVTLVGMALLAGISVAGTRLEAVDLGWTALPLGLLALNLFAAMVSNRSFRTQTGLLVFHSGLLLVFLLAGLTVLIRFDGHVEVVQGAAFEAPMVEVTEQGWLHPDRLESVDFAQGAVRVEYLPGLRRRTTRSTITVPGDDGGPVPVTVGDRDTVTLAGYRIAATFNKGFAVVLGWHGDDGSTSYGSVHFPSYPEFDWKQRAEWTTPAGESLVVELDLEKPPLRVNDPWVLEQVNLPYRLRIVGADDAVLRAGDSVALTGGRLSLLDLRLWMAYRIDYLPLLPWMLAAALLATLGLVLHYRSHFLRRPGPVACAEHSGRDRFDVAAA